MDNPLHGSLIFKATGVRAKYSYGVETKHRYFYCLLVLSKCLSLLSLSLFLSFFLSSLLSLSLSHSLFLSLSCFVFSLSISLFLSPSLSLSLPLSVYLSFLGSYSCGFSVTTNDISFLIYLFLALAVSSGFLLTCLAIFVVFFSLLLSIYTQAMRKSQYPQPLFLFFPVPHFSFFY